jgi:hypothetical protein
MLIHKDQLLSRRALFQSSLVGVLGASFGFGFSSPAAKFRVATFSIDVTPPIGHPLCGGWITPVTAVDDPLRALGVVLLGPEQPIVLCAVDWCGILNEANLAWRQALAEAVGTAPNRVALQTVHPHNAPFADVRAERILQAAPQGPPALELKFFERVVRESAAAVKKSLEQAQPLTHVGTGQAKVEKVAGNRRIIGPDGKVASWRGSACKDPKAVAAPEGLIDPWLKTLSFWNGDQPVAALNYYATHPMSYYGDGRVSADFCGLARQLRQEEDAQVLQLYFNGGGGNVAAGKYNDGSHENRPVLRDRIYEAMRAAWKATERHPVERVSWRSEPVRLPAREEPEYGAAANMKIVESETETKARRGIAAMKLSWLERIERPIDITCLDLGPAQIVHLPGEPFIEYQLHAQQAAPGKFVCTAGYGDGGPFYIPTADAYPQGGYEVGVAFTGPGSEAILKAALTKVLRAD